MKILSLACLFFTIIILTSCLDVIDFEVKEYIPHVIVDGEIQDLTENQIIRLSVSQPYLQQGEFRISGATIELFENNLSLGFYQEETNGRYSFTLKAGYGNAYHLKVTLPQIEDYPQFSNQIIYSSPEILKPVTPITRAGYSFRKAKPNVFEEGYYVFIDTYDPPGTGDFYQWKLYKNGILLNSPLEMTLQSDELIDGNQLTELYFFDTFEKGDVVTIQQTSISKYYFEYLNGIYTLAVSQGGLFDVPGFNPAPNLQAEIPVQGFFNASSYSVATVEILD